MPIARKEAAQESELLYAMSDMSRSVTARLYCALKLISFIAMSVSAILINDFPGIGKYQRATERLHYQVFHQHTEGISQQSLSRDFKIGKATIERWYHKQYLLANQEIKNQDCPSVLGIDEHLFSKKQGYATTFCNLKKHKIFDIVKGRSAKDLGNYLDHLPGKERVKVVCIDLSSSYRHIIQRYFPNAKIVADRFHVIRLMLHQCMQTYCNVSG